VESKEEQRKREARQRTRRWLERHPEYEERRRELHRVWYGKNKDQIRAKAREKRRQLYALDPGPIRATNHEWYLRNKEQRHQYYLKRKAAEPEESRRARERERGRQRYLKDPKKHSDYLKQWRKKNPAKAHAYVRAVTYKRREGSAGQFFTAIEWLALLEWHGCACIYCGSKTLIEIDHRIPLIRGGSNLIENIAPACRSCNRRKNRRTEDEFRALLQRERAQGLWLGLAGLNGNAGTTNS
jgi:5-methylcytosine-specific restriction endonuclease McrA